MNRRLKDGHQVEEVGRRATGLDVNENMAYNINKVSLKAQSVMRNAVVAIVYGKDF
jgi:hypothetical protein